MMTGSGTNTCSPATTGKDSVSPPPLPRTSVLITEALEAGLTAMLAGRKPHSLTVGNREKNKAFSLFLGTAFSKNKKRTWKYLNYCSLAEFLFGKNIFYNLMLFVDMGPE